MWRHEVNMSIQSFERRLNSALAAVEVEGSVRQLSAIHLVHFIQIHVISIPGCYQVRIYETKTRLLYVPSTVQLIIAVASFSIRH